MILDSIENAALYSSVSQGICDALSAAANYPTLPYITGKTEINDDKLFLLALEYETKWPDGDAFMEAHQKYIDVMYMVDGEELIYVKQTSSLTKLISAYDGEKDALLAELDKNMTEVHLKAGDFVILFPQDAHCPGCCVDSPKTVKKIICKVAIQN